MNIVGIHDGHTAAAALSRRWARRGRGAGGALHPHQELGGLPGAVGAVGLAARRPDDGRRRRGRVQRPADAVRQEPRGNPGRVRTHRLASGTTLKRFVQAHRDQDRARREAAASDRRRRR